MPTLSTYGLMATSYLVGAACYGLAHFWPRTRHRQARSLDWLQQQTPITVRYSGGLWSGRLSDGRVLYSRDKSALEAMLDREDNRKGGPR